MHRVRLKGNQTLNGFTRIEYPNRELLRRFDSCLERQYQVAATQTSTPWYNEAPKEKSLRAFLFYSPLNGDMISFTVIRSSCVLASFRAPVLNGLLSIFAAIDESNSVGKVEK